MVAIAATVAAIGVALALKPILDTTSLAPFYGSVALAVWFGGLGPGVLALALGMGASAIVIWHPVFDLSSTGGHDLTRWLIFSSLGILVVAFGNELHRRQDRLEETSGELLAVQGVTEVFGRAKNPTEIADAVLTRGLRVVEARSGAVYVFDEEQGELVLQRAVGYTPELMETLQRVPLDARVPIAVATRTREAVFLGSPAEMREQFGDDLTEPYLPVGNALAAVPLFHRSEPVGAIVFAFPEEQDFSEDQVSSILALAALCEEAMARARQQQAEHTISLTLQRSLLPLRLPELPGMEVAVDYLPGAAEADVGGDWYDGVVLDDGRVVLTVGDIAGRGVQAAALMSRLRIALKCYAVDGSGPAEALSRLDAFIAHLPEDYFATVVMIRVDPETGEVEYACAGHPPPVLITGGTAILLEEGRSGPIDVGVPPSERTDGSVQLVPGDALLLYTDGLIEQREKPLSEGLQVLLDSLADLEDYSARVLVNRVIGRLRAEHGLEDDVALLALRFLHPASQAAESAAGAESLRPHV